MGCKVSKTNDEVIRSFSFGSGIRMIPPKFPGNEELSENSLNECSSIPMVFEPLKVKGSEEPSIFKVFQDVRDPISGA
jgi:hypothetical protein